MDMRTEEGNKEKDKYRSTNLLFVHTGLFEGAPKQHVVWSLENLNMILHMTSSLTKPQLCSSFLVFFVCFILLSSYIQACTLVIKLLHHLRLVRRVYPLRTVLGFPHGCLFVLVGIGTGSYKRVRNGRLVVPILKFF